MNTACSEQEKAELSAKHLVTNFYTKWHPVGNQSNNCTPAKRLNSTTFIDRNCERDDTNINSKKAPGIDKISPLVFQEFSMKAVLVTTYLFNDCLCMKHMHTVFNMVQLIILKKSDIPVQEMAFYRLISSISNLFKELQLKWSKTRGKNLALFSVLDFVKTIWQYSKYNKLCLKLKNH